jgi:hypothetical protein
MHHGEIKQCATPVSGTLRGGDLGVPIAHGSSGLPRSDARTCALGAAARIFAGTFPPVGQSPRNSSDQRPNGERVARLTAPRIASSGRSLQQAWFGMARRSFSSARRLDRSRNAASRSVQATPRRPMLVERQSSPAHRSGHRTERRTHVRRRAWSTPHAVRAVIASSTSCPDGALCTRYFLYISRNPARTSGFSY